MKLIVISPENGSEELKVLMDLFSEGLEDFHLRKPGMSEAALKEYLDSIPSKWHKKIILHSHHSLADLFKIKGIHYPEKVRRATTSYPRHIQLSTSFHTLQDLIASPKVFDYVFLSPIFNSISKDGYNAGFDLEELKQVLENIGHHVIALGGVDENNLLITEELGFAGVAVLGAIWEDSNPVEKFKRIKKILDKTR